jgi:hypothetical protein
LVGGFVLLASLVIGIIFLAAPRNPQRPEARGAVMPPPAEVPEINPAPEPPAKQPKDPLQVGKNTPTLPDAVKTGNGVLRIPVSLAPGAEHVVKFRVKAGHAATITVAPLLAPGKSIDLNMQVFKESDNALVAADETPNPSASVAFTLPAAEIVRVRIHNASKKATVTQFTIVYNVGN